MASRRKPYPEITVAGIREPIAFIIDRLDVVVNPALTPDEMSHALRLILEENIDLKRTNVELERTFEYLHRELHKLQQLQQPQQDEEEA